MKSLKIKRMSFQYLKGHVHSVVFLFVCVIIATVFNSITPLFYGCLIDKISSGDQQNFIFLLLGYAALLLCSSIIATLEEYIMELTGNKIYKEHQRLMFEKILNSRYEDIEKLEIGELMAYLTVDIGTVIQYDISFVTTVLFLILNFIIPFCFIFSINRKLSFFALFFIPLTFLIYWMFREKKKCLQKEYQKSQDSYNSFTINILQNIPSIKSYKVENSVVGQYYNEINVIYKLEKKKGFLENIIDFLNNMTNLVFQISFLMLSNTMILSGELTLGNMVALGMYVNKIFLSVEMMQKIQLDEQNVTVSLKRLNKVKNIQNEDESGSSDIRITKRSYSLGLSVRGLCFSYHSTGKILNNLCIDIGKPGLYSIVGRNGCGKSTLFKILLCLYAPQNGSLSLNGYYYSECPVSYIRNHITYIQKDPFILRDSLLENIRLYDQTTEEDILRYCDMVGLQEYISGLPNGINTNITEQGLSSGQRQKLSFARALAHKSQIMMFDEITSDLDGVSEKKLTNLLKALSRTVIVLSISHRIQTIVESDRIYVLDDGHFIAEGTYKQLKQECGLFSELFYAE